jgi:dihydrofolate reductase
MSKVKVLAFTISIDGFGAGPNQSVEAPLGVGGETLHKWMLHTRSFRQMYSTEAGDEDVDDSFVTRSFENIGAWIMGRNMFGPVRGSWPDDSWKGWWGDNPPYHVPVFVLTHHAREPLEMEGGTTFHFVTSGIHEALKRAKEGAQGKDIRIGGGAATVRQYLEAGLIDEMHLAISPVLLGRGEAFFAGIDLNAAGFRCTEQVATEHAMHVILTKQA